MCGIVGYLGEEQAAPILLEGLSRLEYRGYDSAGIAVRDEDKKTEIVKAKGRLQMLSEKTDAGWAVHGSCGIGHTRWATHGEPSETNAHPHSSNDGSVILVHNGIIENYQDLRERLIHKGYTFYSETDTEVAANLVDYQYKKCGGDPLEALSQSMMRIRGSYALVIMFEDFPEEIFAARKDSPMIIGRTEDAFYVASDVPAILKYTRNVYYIGNLEMVHLTRGDIHFYNIEKDEIHKDIAEIKWDDKAAEKGGYEHFMMKEIHEQPAVVRDTMNSLIRDGRIDLSEIGLTDEDIRGIGRVCFVACGSAYHVGVSLKYVIEDLARIPVDVDLASEFRYRKPILSDDTLVIIISQSGETADSLAALREAKERGLRTLGIVNVIGSSIAREADNVLYTLAGPEIAVATTKGYSTQLIACYLLAMQFGLVRGTLSEEEFRRLSEEIQTLPDKIDRIIEDKERIQWFASKFAHVHDIFFVGRGVDYAICLEGSLKVKEVSYVHSEAYAAGELKHGTIALIDQGRLVVALACYEALFDKTMSNIKEVKARGAKVLAVTREGGRRVFAEADDVLFVPVTDPLLAAIPEIVPLQLFAYHVAKANGCDIDKPRNLAKSVTVE